MSVKEIILDNQYDLRCRNMTIHDNLDVTGNISVVGSVNIPTIHVTSTDNSTSFDSGALIVNGGLGVAKDLNVEGTLTATNIVYKSTEIVTNTENSTSTNSGALQVAGGAGIAKNLYIGGNEVITGNSTTYGNLLTSGNLFVGNNIYGNYVTSTTASISSTSGGFVVAGGLSVAKNANFGQDINATYMTLNAGIPSTDTLTGDLVVSGGIGVGNNINIAGNLSVAGSSSLYSEKILSSANSTSTNTGSLQVAGGCAIAGNLYCGNGTGSTSSSTGSVIVNGGMGINGQIRSSAGIISYIAGGGNNLQAKSDSGSIANILLGTGSSISGTRWMISKTAEAETGSNVGSNLAISRYGDDSLNIDTPLSINRETGIINCGVGVNTTSPTTGSIVVNGGIGSDRICTNNFIFTNTSFSSPEVFGAIGDGLTNDTTALQNCINANKNIIFGYGKTYRITSTLTISQPCNINFNNSTILTNDGITLTNFMDITTGEYVTGNLLGISIASDNVSIYNGTIKQIPNCIKSNCNSNISIYDMKFNLYGSGLNFGSSTADCKNITFRNLDFNDGRAYCMWFASHTYTIYNLVVSNCKFYNYGVWGYVSYKLNNALFENCNFSFDTTYTTWYCPVGAPNHLLYRYLNRRYNNSWRYDVDIIENTSDTVELYAYTFESVDTTFLNCNFANSVSTDCYYKLSQGSTNLHYIDCQFDRLFQCVPHTYIGSGTYIQDITFDNCTLLQRVEIPVLNDTTTLKLTYNNCRLLSVFSWAVGLRANCEMTFNDCIFSGASSSKLYTLYTLNLGENYAGFIRYNSCIFDNIVDNGESFYLRTYNTAGDTTAFNDAVVQFYDCNFNGTTGGVVLNSLLAMSFKEFSFKKCVFRGTGFTNYLLQNVMIEDCEIFDGTVATDTGGLTFVNNVFHANVPTSKCIGYTVNPSVNAFTTYNLNEVNQITTEQILNDGNITFASSLYNSLQPDMTKASFFNPSNYSGVSIVSNKALVTSGNVLSYIINSNVDYGSQGNITFKFTPSVVDPLVDSLYMCQISLGGGANNLMRLINDSGGYIYLRMYNNTGTSFTQGTNITRKHWTIGQTYIIEIDWDCVNAKYAVYIDGTLYNVSGPTATRNSGDTISFGKPATLTGDFSFNDVTISNQPKYVPAASHTITSYYVCPQISSVGQINITNTKPNDGYAAALNVNGGIRCGSDMVILNTTTSNSTSTGSLIVSGGVGIAKDVIIGANLTVNSNTILQSCQLYDTTNSTSVTRGALIISGGCGIAKNLYIGGNETITKGGLNDQALLTVSQTNSNNVLDNAVIQILAQNNISSSLIFGSTNNTKYIKFGRPFTGGGEIGNFLNLTMYDGSNTFDIVKYRTTNITVSPTTESTSSTNGSLIISGGCGLAKSLNIGLDCTVNRNLTCNNNTILQTCQLLDTTNSISKTTGSLIISGGSGIGKNLYVGGNLYANNLPYVFYNMGNISSNSNTDAYFSLNPSLTTISDSLLFGYSYPSVHAYGRGSFGNLDATVLTLKLQMIIDSTTYVFFESSVTASDAITQTNSFMDIVYKIIPVTGSTFDIYICGSTTFSDTGMGGINAFNAKQRPIYLFSNNGGAHFTRGTNYSFDAQYKFNTASTSNYATIIQVRHELLNLY